MTRYVEGVKYPPSNPAGGVEMYLVNVVCRQLEVSVSGWSLLPKSPTECGVSECDHEASWEDPGPQGAVVPGKK